MASKSPESIAKEIAEVVSVKSKLINDAKSIVIKEIDKYDSLVYVPDERNGLIVVTGNQYGRATLDLNRWFVKIKVTYPPEHIARDMLEDIQNQLAPSYEHMQ